MRSHWLLNNGRTNLINTTGATSGAGTAYPSGAPECTPRFQRGSCYSIFSFRCMFCRPLFVLFLVAIVLSVLLRYTDSDCPFCIFKLFLIGQQKPGFPQLFVCLARVISLSEHLSVSIFSRWIDITSTRHLLFSFEPIICKLNYSHVMICDKVTCDRSVVFSINKTNRNDITEIFWKVAFNTKTLTP